MSALGSWCDRRGCGGDDKPQKVVMISIAADGEPTYQLAGSIMCDTPAW